ncbi:hypothetical protein EBB79_10270 [Parasedimentitalea marina]|uniref:Uncharacterized protein n=1 Tax=Parasedimentitalea marina TaxID=2483033 RepID=A0A3T0N2H5_9RHOB|nr:hypothetical protein [Parasedimentitalea marina]AZV78223.1 hypothetical protein EBB79_10270 [Parasedimentitalea marina]
MTYQDRNTVVSIFVNLAVSAFVVLRLLEMNASGMFEGSDAVNNWARLVIWLIPLGIVATITGTILFNIGFAIFTNEPKPSFIVDERDKLFERRGNFAIIAFAGAGFVTAVIVLALDASALIGFNIIYFGMAFGSLAADIVKFVSYRRGY